MGHNTWKSLGLNPLKNRMNIVITNHKYDLTDDSIHYTNSFEDGILYCLKYVMQNLEVPRKYKISVIGGKQIYDQAIQYNFNKSYKLHGYSKYIYVLFT